jgi:hypothetical protein
MYGGQTNTARRLKTVTTEEFTIELFFRIDEELADVEKHSRARLYPSEVITLAFLFALKGVGNRAFYRWLVREQRMSRTSTFSHSFVGLRTR